MVGRDNEIFTPIMTRSNDVNGELWVRERMSLHDTWVNIEPRSLEKRSKVGNFFKNLGKDIKKGFQKAGGWLKNNWPTVLGVATKLIPI